MGPYPTREDISISAFPCLHVNMIKLVRFVAEDLFFCTPIDKLLCLFHRFWAIPDPAKMDEEASSVEKHQPGALRPIDNCEKKASLKNIVIKSSTAFFNTS